MLILDDLTSALDAATTEFILKETIGRVLKGKTVIMSTNDMSLLKFADYLYYMEDGRVVQEGDFRSIQSSELWKKQQELLDEIQAQKTQAREELPPNTSMQKLELKKELSIIPAQEKNYPQTPSKKIKSVVIFGVDIGLYVYLFREMGGFRKLAIIIALMTVESLASDY